MVDGLVDPDSARYNDVSDAEREKLWSEVHWLYEKLDAILGELLARAGENTFVVLSSDHGAVPLNKQVRINNLFAREGLLKFSTEPSDRRARHRLAGDKGCVPEYAECLSSARRSRRKLEAERWVLITKVPHTRDWLAQGLQDSDGVRPLEQVVNWERCRQGVAPPAGTVGRPDHRQPRRLSLDRGDSPRTSNFLLFRESAAASRRSCREQKRDFGPPS